MGKSLCLKTFIIRLAKGTTDTFSSYYLGVHSRIFSASASGVELHAVL